MRVNKPQITTNESNNINIRFCLFLFQHIWISCISHKLFSKNSTFAGGEGGMGMGMTALVLSKKKTSHLLRKIQTSLTSHTLRLSWAMSCDVSFYYVLILKFAFHQELNSRVVET